MPSNMSPCQVPSALRRRVLTACKKPARSEVVAHRSKHANLCGTVTMRPSTLCASDTPRVQPAKSAGRTWAGMQTALRPASRKAWVTPAGDFTWAIGSPTMKCTRVAPLKAWDMSGSRVCQTDLPSGGPGQEMGGLYPKMEFNSTIEFRSIYAYTRPPTQPHIHPMPPTRLVVIGAGLIVRAHIERIHRHPELQLAGIADPTPSGQALAAELGVPWQAEAAALLDQVQPQGAVVATPNVAHIPVALECLARGIPALVEKPVADTVAEARKLVEASERTGVPGLVGHHRRHNPSNQRARALIEGGQLGRIVSATALATVFKPEPYFNVAWRRQVGGGPILINLIHDIDMLRFLLGEVAEVQAMDSHAVRGFEVEDTAAAVLRFASGALATVIVSDATTSPWCWDMCAGEQGQYPRQDVASHQIMGTHGSLSLPDLGLWQYRGPRGWHDELSHEETRVHAADPYTRQLEHFAAVIAGQAEPLCSAPDGLRTLAATLAVHDAAVK